MSRAKRLLDLMEILRRHRHPVSGQYLAGHLGISLRTLYRDIAALQEQGAEVEGERGIGYVLRPGFHLPPMMFSAEEIEALVLGARWVGRHTDPRLAAAAGNALAKIAAVLPPRLRDDMDGTALLVGPGEADGVSLGGLRHAIRAQHKLCITYRDAGDAVSERIVWPFALGFFDHVRVLAAWCELRQAIRHFRTDRLIAVTATGIRYPRHRQALLKEWREREGIAPS